MGKEVKMIIKKDLLEKLNDIDETADVTEVLKGIDGIAEVKEIPFDVNKLTVEDYKNILETNKAIQGYNQSQLDSAVSKGVESFKTKKMPGIIESEIKKATAPKHETPEQKAQREQMEAMETRLKEMEEKNDRKAQFRTIISLIEKGEERQFEGIVKGQITREKRGESGFGYDPIFQPDGYETTFAELGRDIKNRISHRARGVAALCDYLRIES